MNSLFLSLLIVSIFAVPMFLAIGVVFWMKRRSEKARTSPLTNDLMRPAGFSVGDQLDDKRFDLMGMFALMPAIAVLPITIGLAQSHLLGTPDTWLRWGMLIVVTLIGMAYALRKTMALFREVTYLKLGYSCEVAVAQQLDQVVRPAGCGYQVYHDIPFPNFNIDHLVITPRGVFVIETKGRSKPLSDGGKQFKVTLKGGALHFPNHVEREPLEQTRRNVKSVKEWLNKATGFEVPVAGVLVLPGWYLEYKERVVEPYVLSAGALPSQLPKLFVDHLDTSQVTAIAYQVEQRVRDVDSGTVRLAEVPG